MKSSRENRPGEGPSSTHAQTTRQHNQTRAGSTSLRGTILRDTSTGAALRDAGPGASINAFDCETGLLTP